MIKPPNSLLTYYQYVFITRVSSRALRMTSNCSDRRISHQYQKLFQAFTNPVNYIDIGTEVYTNIHVSQSMNSESQLSPDFSSSITMRLNE